MTGTTANCRCMFTTLMTLSPGSWSFREERAVSNETAALPLGSHCNLIVVVYYLKVGPL